MGGGILIALIIGVVVGCQLFEQPHSTEVTAPVTDAALNYIVLPGRIAEWQAYYVPGTSAFSVNIPLAGVMRIRYYLDGGGCFAIYLSALYPPLVEVGLEPNADGSYPIVANVSVDYLENGSFTLPANAVADEQPNYTKYLRQDADGNLIDWWPCEEGVFGWSGQFSTKDVLIGGALGEGVAEGTLAPRPEPEPEHAPAVPPEPPVPPIASCPATMQGPQNVGGVNWYLGAGELPLQSCTEICAAAGAPYNDATRDYAGSGGTDEHCREVATAFNVDVSNFFTANAPFGDGVGCIAEWGAVDRVIDPETTADASDPGWGSVICRFCACQ